MPGKSRRSAAPPPMPVPPAPPGDAAQAPADDRAEELAADTWSEDEGPGEIVMRPDGLHWITADGRQEFGPFETLEQLREHRNAVGAETPEPPETLQEAERDIGIADWIDPATGEPAEGQCPPHLDEE